MNGKAIFCALLMVALVATPAAIAQAGGGGFGGPGGELFLQCYGVASGPNPPHQLEVNDQFIDPTAEKVGKLKMICTFADVSVINQDVPGTDLNVVDTVAADRHIMCYEITGAKAHATVIYNDTFFPGDQTASPPTGQTAKVEGDSKFICVLGNKTCLKGCPPPTGP